MKKLYNPFETVSENRLLILGIAFTIMGSLTGWLFNARYDGVLDMHLDKPVELWQPFTDNIINIFSLTTLLLIAGKIVNRKTRFIDILIATLIARAPFYILPLTNIGGKMEESSERLLEAATNVGKMLPEDLAYASVMGLVSIFILVWAMALLYNGYRVATNLKKTSQILGYIGIVIAAEIISKIIISIIPY